MNEVNPYSPPKAAVSDMPTMEPAPRPRLVDIAVMLLWTDLSVWAISSLFAISAGETLRDESPAVIVAVLAISLGFNAWLIVKVAAGRNWARILWLVLSAVGMIAAIFTPFPGSLLQRLSLLLQTLMALAAFAILLMPSASRWFKQKV